MWLGDYSPALPLSVSSVLVRDTASGSCTIKKEEEVRESMSFKRNPTCRYRPNLSPDGPIFERQGGVATALSQTNARPEMPHTLGTYN